METVNEKKVIFPLNGLRVCVDRFSEYDIAGRVYGRMAGEMFFSSFSEFLLKADRFMDEKKFPQSFQKKRTFDEKAEVQMKQSDCELSDQEIICQTGEKMTFDLVIQSRKRTTWQGFFRMEPDRSVESFGSVLELTEKFFAKLEQVGTLKS